MNQAQTLISQQIRSNDAMLDLVNEKAIDILSNNAGSLFIFLDGSMLVYDNHTFMEAKNIHG